MAGPRGNELFVSYMNNRLDFSREDINHRQQFRNNRNSDGIPNIATETHVVVVVGNTVKLYRIVSDDRLVELCQSMPLGRSYRNDDEYYHTAISWGVDESEFIIYHSIMNFSNFHDEAPTTSNITVWGFNAEADTMSRTKTFDSDIVLKKIVFGEDFIVGSCKLKKLHIWDRHTGQKTQDFLCDIEEDDQLSPNDIIYPLHMSCHGHILVTTSHIGCAICIWNIKTGQLLKRCNNADEERFVDMLPDGTDATSMAYLKPLNGYICATGYLHIWTFPTNQQQSDTAIMIRDREEDLRQNEL